MPRWLNFLRHQPCDPVSLERKVTPGQREANAALGRAVAARREVEEQASQVKAVASQLREIRERNHFAEALRTLFEGGH